VIKISVIVPVGKMKGKLKRLEKWVKSEIVDSVEYIFVVDAVGDGTYDELEEILKSTNEVNYTLVQGRFGSPGLARNYGMNFAKGSWITFWDSDDIGHPSQLVKNIEKAEELEFPIVVSGAIVHKVGNMPAKHIKYQPNKDSDLLYFPGMWRFSFRKELASELKFQPFRMGEDQVFLIELLEETNRKYFDPNIVYEYFSNQEGQLTANADAIQELTLTLKYLKKTLSKNKEPQDISIFLFLRMSLTLFVRNINRKSALRAITFSLINWPLTTCNFFWTFIVRRSK